MVRIFKLVLVREINSAYLGESLHEWRHKTKMQKYAYIQYEHTLLNNTLNLGLVLGLYPCVCLGSIIARCFMFLPKPIGWGEHKIWQIEIYII
jgi:hypothetical protein